MLQGVQQARKHDPVHSAIREGDTALPSHGLANRKGDRWPHLLTGQPAHRGARSATQAAGTS